MKKIFISVLLMTVLVVAGVTFAEEGHTPLLDEGYGIYASDLMTITYDPNMVTIHNRFLDQTTYVYITETVENSDLGRACKATVTVADGSVYEGLDVFIVHPYSNAIFDKYIKVNVDYPVDKGFENEIYTQEYEVAEVIKTEAPYVNVFWTEQQHDFSGDYQFDFDVMPQTINGRTMVPLRAIFEAFGYDVTWDDQTKTASCDNGYNVMMVTIGSETVTLKDNESQASVSITSDTPPMLVGGRTMVPLRVISEVSGLSVVWDGTNRIVYLDGQRPSEAIDLSDFETLVIPEADELVLKTVKVADATENTKDLYPFSVEYIGKYYCGYMDFHGNVIIEPKYTSAPDFVSGYSVPVKNFGEGAAIINENGKEILKGAYIIGDLSENAFTLDFIAVDASTHVNTKGERLYEQYYSSVDSFSGGLAKVWDEDAVLLVDNKGKEYLRDSLYDVVKTTNKDYMVIANDRFESFNGSQGVVDLNGIPFIPLMFVSVNEIEEGFEAFYEDRLHYFNMSGEEITLEEVDATLLYEDEKMKIYYSLYSEDSQQITIENKVANKEKVIDGKALNFFEIYGDRAYFEIVTQSTSGTLSSEFIAVDVDTLTEISGDETYVAYLKNGYFKVFIEDKEYYGIAFIDVEVIKPDMVLSSFEYNYDDEDDDDDDD